MLFLLPKKTLELTPFSTGKTSILQFLFNNLDSKQTFYLETTTRVTTHTFEYAALSPISRFILTLLPISTIIPLELWDCPGVTTIDTLNVPLAQFSTIVFVFDIQVLHSPHDLCEFSN